MLLFVLPFAAPLFGEIQEVCAERPAVRRQAKAMEAGEVRNVELLWGSRQGRSLPTLYSSAGDLSR